MVEAFGPSAYKSPMRNPPGPHLGNEPTRAIFVLADRLAARSSELEVVGRYADRDDFSATVFVGGSPRALSATVAKLRSNEVRISLSVGPVARIEEGQAARLMSRLKSRHGLFLIVQGKATCWVSFFARAREWLQPEVAEEVLARLEELVCALTPNAPSGTRLEEPMQLDLASELFAVSPRSGDAERTQQLALSLGNPDGGQRRTLGDAPSSAKRVEVVSPMRPARALVDRLDEHAKIQAARALVILEERLRARGSEVKVVTRKLKDRLPVTASLIVAGRRRLLGATFSYADSAASFWIELDEHAIIDEPRSSHLKRLLDGGRRRLSVAWSSFRGSANASIAMRDLLTPEAMEDVITRLEEIVCALEPRPSGACEGDEATQLGLKLGLVVVSQRVPRIPTPGSQLRLPLLTDLRR